MLISSLIMDLLCYAEYDESGGVVARRLRSSDKEVGACHCALKRDAHEGLTSNRHKRVNQ